MISKSFLPEVVAGIGNFFDNWVQYLEVGRRTLEKKKRHGAFCRRLPGDAVFLADWNNIVEAGGVERVALWLSANWLCVRARKRDEARKTCCEEAEKREIGHVADCSGGCSNRNKRRERVQRRVKRVTMVRCEVLKEWLKTNIFQGVYATKSVQ